MDNVRKIFAIRLKKLRLNAHITQQMLSEAIRVGQSTIATYEKGGIEPTGEVLSKLADYFHCTTDYLLGRASKPQHETRSELAEAITKLGIIDILKGAEITLDDIKFFEDAAKALRILKILRTEPESEDNDGGG